MTGASANQHKKYPDFLEKSEFTLKDACRLIREGALSSEDLVRFFIERIKHDTGLNAFICTDTQQALEQAREFDQKDEKSKALLPLGGIPIVVKDNIHVAGFPNTAGTVALKGFVPHRDAPVVQLLREAGAIILGKTHMHELAFGVTGYNPAFGNPAVTGTRNAYDRDKIAGGSSSGSAVAVAAKMACAALGTDTGGSVRIPAAMNGVVGFRPTIGRYDGKGITPISDTRDTPGIIARSVGDVIFLDNILTRQAADKQLLQLSKIRLGLPGYFWSDLETDIRDLAQAACIKLQEAGIELITLEIPGLDECNSNISMPVVLYEQKKTMIRYLQENGCNITFEQLVAGISSPDVKAIFDTMIVPERMVLPSGELLDLEPLYQRAIMVEQPRLIELYQHAFDAYQLDGLLFPTVVMTAMPASAEASSAQNFMRIIRNTDPGSNAGLPGLSVPAGLTEQGLPLGLEIDALPHQDEKLMTAGVIMEAALGPLRSPLFTARPGAV